MRRSFKYRLFTNANQERELGIALETHRRLYNECLSLREMMYQCYGERFNYYDCGRWFKLQRGKNPYYSRINYSSAQATLRRLEKAFVRFFQRVKDGSSKPGHPRLQGRDRFNSIEFMYRDGVRLADSRLYVQYVGTIRVKLHRPVEGTIKTAVLKRECGKWYVVFSCELPDVPLVVTGKPPTGIDVGLTHFLTTSEGVHEPNPRYLKTALPELRRAGRAVSRKKKGGANRRKAVRCLQKVHARVVNLRREHHHQVACRLVLAFSSIAVEALNIKGMLANGRLSRAISDAGWSGFLNVLKHKAAKVGVQFVEVDPRGTSQQCSRCDQEVKKDLSVRWHDCPHCGLSLDRDHNAALNILARARLVRTEPAEHKHPKGVVPRSPRNKAKV